jgi:hypothetical protein
LALDSPRWHQTEGTPRTNLTMDPTTINQPRQAPPSDSWPQQWKSVEEYEAWFPVTDEEYALATDAEKQRATDAIFDAVHEEIERAERQQVAPDPMGGIGLLPGEPPAPVYVPILSGQDPDATGKIFCVSPAHDDVHTPNMHVYHDHVHCFKCGFGTKLKGFAAMVLGLGWQEGTAWRTHSTERPAIDEYIHNLGLAQGGERKCQN